MGSSAMMRREEPFRKRGIPGDSSLPGMPYLARIKTRSMASASDADVAVTGIWRRRLPAAADLMVALRPRIRPAGIGSLRNLPEAMAAVRFLGPLR
jgi:hypothetical protein